MTAAKHHSAIIGRLCVVQQEGSVLVPFERLCSEYGTEHIDEYTACVLFEQPWAGVVVDVQSLLHDDGDIESVFLVADSAGAVFPVRRASIRLKMTAAERRTLTAIEQGLPDWSELQAKAIEEAKAKRADDTEAVAEWRAAQTDGGA
jgi:hypothetical protein